MPLSLSKSEFAAVLRSLPADATDDQIAQATKAAENGSPLSKLWTLVNRPLAGSADALIPGLRHEHAPDESGFRTTVEDLGSTLTSPISLGTAALSGGAALAGAKGLTRTSELARMGEAALQAPFVAEGVHNMATGNTLGEKLAGGVEAALGGAGMRGALKGSRLASSEVGELGRSAPSVPELSGPYGILSAENAGRSAEENAARTQQLLSDLVAAGKKPLQQQGYFGGTPEASFLVPGLTPEETANFGRKYGQISVISDKGYHRLADDKVFPSRGVAFNQAAEDYYSELTRPDGSKVKYQLDFPDEAFAEAPAAPSTPPASPVSVQSKALDPWIDPTTGELLLEHRTTVPNLTEVDPNFWNSGTGIAGNERYLSQHYPDLFVPGSYYNLRGTEVEGPLRQRLVYDTRIKPERIYDYGVDPQGFYEQARKMSAFENMPGAMDQGKFASLLNKLPKDAGFAGWRHSTHEDPYQRGVVKLFEKLPVTRRAAEAGGTKALALAGPALAAYPGQFSDDPETDKRIRTYMALGGVGAFGAAAMFPRELKVTLDGIKKQLRDQMRAQNPNAPVRDSVIKTAIRKAIGASTSSKTEADFLEGLYHTIPLPQYDGINFDERQPLKNLLAKGRTSKLAFKRFTTDRFDKLYDVGHQQGSHWGNPEWIQKLVGDDPQLGIKFGRTLGALSPGAKTHENAAQAAEVFVRHILNGEPLGEVLDTMRTIRVKNRAGKELNLQRTALGGRIYADKTENLSGNELGIKGRIPIDMWLMRAMGAHTDKTPGPGLYRQIEDAFTRYAETKGEDPFTVMAKIWTGMQKVAGAETPSWQKAFEQMGITGDLTDPATRKWVEENLPMLKERIYERKGLTKAQQAERGAKLAAIPPQPSGSGRALRPVEEFQKDVQNNMLTQQYRGDVLGKIRAIGKDKERLWKRMGQLGVPTEGLTAPKAALKIAKGK